VNEFWEIRGTDDARNDPASSINFTGGRHLGPTNCMLYEGINRYRFDKSHCNTLRELRTLYGRLRINQHNNEQYHAWGGTAVATNTTPGGTCFARWPWNNH
jgi:hypothetical protein